MGAKEDEKKKEKRGNGGWGHGREDEEGIYGGMKLWGSTGPLRQPEVQLPCENVPRFLTVNGPAAMDAVLELWTGLGWAFDGNLRMEERRGSCGN